jgi:hypothetical protein
MPPIRHPCPRRSRPFPPRRPQNYTPGSLGTCLAASGAARLWQRPVGGQHSRAGVLSKPDATEASELTATPPSQADKGPSCCRRFWGGLGPTLRGVACPWPCLCCLLVHSHTHTQFSMHASAATFQPSSLLHRLVCLCVCWWCASVQSLTAHSQKIRRVSVPRQEVPEDQHRQRGALVLLAFNDTLWPLMMGRNGLDGHGRCFRPLMLGRRLR